MRLPEAFQTRHPLRFRPDGGYRILMMSDAHLKPGKEERTLRAMETLIDGTRPDLVLLNGDNVAAFTDQGMFEAHPLGACVRQPRPDARGFEGLSGGRVRTLSLVRIQSGAGGAAGMRKLFPAHPGRQG